MQEYNCHFRKNIGNNRHLGFLFDNYSNWQRFVMNLFKLHTFRFKNRKRSFYVSHDIMRIFIILCLFRRCYRGMALLFLCIAFSSLNKLYSKSHFWHIILWCTLLLNKQRMIFAVIRNVNMLCDLISWTPNSDFRT